MMLVSLGLLAAHAGINSDLLSYCPDGYETWRESDVSTNDWYWGDDWDEFLANGTSPDGTDPGPIYPAGFRQYTLGQYSQPPICMKVQNSRDYKVEILMESPLENANLCIHDASYNGVGNNAVGNVENCGSGKIYACFTAATATDQDFGFYTSCNEGCEDMAVDVWIRVRISPTSWDTGKTGVADDLEHWCATERGTPFDTSDPDSPLYYTYPSDLIPDEPSSYPFHIKQLFGNNSGSHTRPRVWLFSVLAFVGLAYLLA